MTAALLSHIAGGSIAMASGAACLAVRKGGRLHRVSGRVFIAAMLVMATAATLLAAQLMDWANLPGGLFATYLVMTGWAALMHNKARAAWICQAALALGGGAAAAALLLAAQANASASGLINGKPAPLFAIFAGITLFAVSQDMLLLRRQQPTRRQQLARHIWRMCTALFLATGSFFLGQQKVMPTWMQGSPLLFVLALSPLLLMGFWMLRTALWKRSDTAISASAA